jgi:hypothetical protein
MTRREIDACVRRAVAKFKGDGIVRCDKKKVLVAPRTPGLIPNLPDIPGRCRRITAEEARREFART